MEEDRVHKSLTFTFSRGMRAVIPAGWLAPLNYESKLYAQL